MKKQLGILSLVILLFGAVAFATPVDILAGFRSVNLGSPIPTAGIVIGEATSVSAELYKVNFWDLEWAGRYVLDGTLTVPVSLGVSVIAGISWPIDVTTDPTTFAFNDLRMPLGVSFGRGYPADIFARGIFRLGEGGGYESFELGFKVNLIGAIQYLFPGHAESAE